MAIWHLKKGSERKFRFGHPWVFSSELALSPKGIQPGEVIELRDHQGGFLARGYGHPNSQISFRALTLDGRIAIDTAFFIEALSRAARLRELAGVDRQSHRLCFAEGDYLPGLVIDRYFLAPSAEAKAPAVGVVGQVFVVQSSTAGIDLQMDAVLAAIEALVGREHAADGSRCSWANTSVIVANDAKSRAMEGIAVEPKMLSRAAEGLTPDRARLLIQCADPAAAPLVFETDLMGGQKTGFFLDQRLNIQLTTRLVRGLVAQKKTIRVLDLCCYVGQWGAQIARAVRDVGGDAQVTLVDSSAAALEFAAVNVENNGGRALPQKADVLDAFGRFAPQSYDVVICDPPAFIKKKKDLPTGTQAYFKMNREALKRTARGGVFVSCSCSGLFLEEDFRMMLARVMQTQLNSDGPAVSWLARGGHSVDHPQRPEFPQGTYLKSWIGVTS